PEYWWFILFTFLGSLVTALIPVVNMIFALAVLIPSLAVFWRRMHDIGKPGYVYFLPFIGALISIFGVIMGQGSPEFGQILIVVGGLIMFGLTILLIVWLASPSQTGRNKYGGDDDAENVENVFA
ncbi:MAG: DUF805 domain-containing protein, partial [Pseudomonadota bacterium]